MGRESVVKVSKVVFRRQFISGSEEVREVFFRIRVGFVEISVESAACCLKFVVGSL